MAVYSGTTMRIKIGSKTIFHETKATFTTSRDFNELASKDINGKEVTPGSYTWSLTCDALIANSTTQEDLASLDVAYQAKTLVTMEFSTDVSGDVVYSGSAYVESYNVDAANEEGVTGSFSFKGSGDYTLGTVA